VRKVPFRQTTTESVDVVGRGEVLERMTTVPAPEGAGFLEALWQGGAAGGPRSSPVLVCPPHPRLGGSMDSGVLAELVWALGRRRHPTLRFNYRGVGASQGHVALPSLPSTTPVDLEPLVQDARAALAQLLQSTGARTVGVVGVSVGAWVAARLAALDAQVERVLLVSPPAGVDDDDAAVAMLGAAVASGVAVSVVVGGADGFVDVAGLQQRLVSLAPPSVVDGADHLFQRGLSELARRAVAVFSTGDDADDFDVM
jgi:hypothetical protein